MNTIVAALIAFGFAYLGLCAYGIAKTSSTDGLADIGNAAIMSVILGALAARAMK